MKTRKACEAYINIIKMLLIIVSMSIIVVVLSTKRATKTIKTKIRISVEWEILPYFKLDSITTSFIIIVLVVSSAVTLFSIFYIQQEKKKKEFNTLTILFVTRILLIVSSPNTVSIILG